MKINLIRYCKYILSEKVSFLYITYTIVKMIKRLLLYIDSFILLKRCSVYSILIFRFYLLLVSFSFYLLSLLPNSCMAQGVGININGNPADSSAGLDVNFTNKGLLVPRMSTSERNAINNPVNSLLIFNTTTQCFEAYYTSGSDAIWATVACIGCLLPGYFSAFAANNIAATGFSANWSIAAGATGYFIDVSTDSIFSGFVAGYNNLDVGNINTFNVSNSITCDTTYYYRVRAYNPCGTSANSTTISVTTVCTFLCGSPFTDSRDGQVYNTVQIGSQCWLAQNLNYGTYSPVHSGSQLPDQKYCTNLSGLNDASCPMGGLYEWDNMMSGAAGCNGFGAIQPGCASPVQGICPVGWHVPSHFEWTLLEKNVGINPSAFTYNASLLGGGACLGTDEGGNLKVISVCGTLPCWNSPNIGATNTSGFSALPGGRGNAGAFFAVGEYGYWWSATDINEWFCPSCAWLRQLESGDDKVCRGGDLKIRSYSVRCVKD
ncbi:MAG TPA: hypothetical protein DEH02_09705 [Bacteroidales bacterium]|nr:hypothetical protein [Bacteroidales bacterium]